MTQGIQCKLYQLPDSNLTGRRVLDRFFSLLALFGTQRGYDIASGLAQETERLNHA